VQEQTLRSYIGVTVGIGEGRRGAECHRTSGCGGQPQRC
jgi:hypothetical protein